MHTPSISILGSGWLGQPLNHHLQQLGYSTKISTRDHAKVKTLTDQGHAAYIVDIDNEQQDYRAFLNSDILIINITHKNLSAFKQLLEQVLTSSIQYVLFISSSSVYQNLQQEVTEDEQAENPDSVLFQIENLFRSHPAIHTTIIRLAGLVGPNRHPGRFFRHGKQVQQADAPVNLIHLDDCIGIISAVLAQNAWGETFNASADSHPKKRDFYPYAAKLANMPPPTFADGESTQYKIVSNQKVKRFLNYQFIHPDLMEIDF